MFPFAGLAWIGVATLANAQVVRDAASVLAQMRAASGGPAWNRVAEIQGRGEMKENGFTGQLTISEDLKTGRNTFKATFSAVNATVGTGVDSTQSWDLQQDGDVSLRAGADHDPDAATDEYLHRRGYWQPGFDGASVILDPPITEDGVAFDRVRIRPAHGREVTLWINAATHLLDREQWGDAAKHYGDYRTANGLKLPFSLRHLTNTHEDYSIQLASIEVRSKLDESDFAIPFHPDFEMPASGVVTVPTSNGTIFDAMINGRGPFKMFFDTGSINVINASAAKELGITAEGSGNKMVTSSGAVEMRAATVKILKLGEVTLHDQPFQVIDFPSFPGEPVGVVGYEFMRRFVVRVDYEHNQMTMYDAARFKPDDAGVEVPMLVESRGVYVKASADGFKGTFALDTGNEVALELDPGFVRINDLVGWTHAKFSGYAGRGYAGPMPEAHFARIHKFQIGGVEADEVAANLLGGEPQQGEPAGNIGRSVLRQFNVTFDAVRGKMYLAKNANWGPVPFNRAGIATDPQDNGLKVMTVLPGGSGEAAGLQVGDMIVKIDGRTPTDDDDQSAFVQPVGTTLHLVVKRGDSTHEAVVVLKDVL
jgi:hypothetical protein